LKGLPRPRRDLYARPAHKSYAPFAFGIEASRGCPYDCEFCSINLVMGRGFRVRPVAEVIAEIDSVDLPHLFFVDDSLGLNRMVAKRLFTEMIPLRRMWVGQGTVSLAADLELLRLMRRSGCRALLIGFESVQQKTQNGMKKTKNLKLDFPEAMRRFHGEGIAVLGAFVFGFDHENKDVFDQTLEFCMKSRLDGAQVRILTPFPGTRLYARLVEERRLLAPDWWLHGYSSRALLFQLKGMTEDELTDGIARLQRHIYSFEGIIKRFFGMSLSKRGAVGAQLYTGFNLAMRRRYFKELRDPQSVAAPRI
ncbi:MAG: radical SAM protein, partial [Candidatus Zixiibacteriota bacterium]